MTRAIDQALFFTTGQSITALTYNRLIPVRQLVDKIVDIGCPASVFYLILGRIQFGIE